MNNRFFCSLVALVGLSQTGSETMNSVSTYQEPDETLISLRAPMPVFTADTAAAFEALGGTSTAAQNLMQYVDVDGRPIMRRGRFFVDAYEQGATEKTLHALLGVQNQLGDTLFQTYPGALRNFLRSEQDAPFAQALTEVVDDVGAALFIGGNYAAQFARRGGTLEYAERMATHVQTEAGLVLTLTRGLDFADFSNFRKKDTALPNCVYTLPADDEDGTFRMRSDVAFRLETYLRGDYDLHFAVPWEERGVGQALRTAGKIDLLVMEGHGDSFGLTLSDYEGEQHSVDIGDRQLPRWFRHLAPDAVICLLGCETDKRMWLPVLLPTTMGNIITGFPLPTFAEHVASSAPGRTVIAARDTFEMAQKNFIVLSTNPLELKIMEEGNDVTSVLRYEKK